MSFHQWEPAAWCDYVRYVGGRGRFRTSSAEDKRLCLLCKSGKPEGSETLVESIDKGACRESKFLGKRSL